MNVTRQREWRAYHDGVLDARLVVVGFGLGPAFHDVRLEDRLVEGLRFRFFGFGLRVRGFSFGVWACCLWFLVYGLGCGF